MNTDENEADQRKPLVRSSAIKYHFLKKQKTFYQTIKYVAV